MRKRSLKVNALLNGIKQCCTILFPLITFPYISRVLGSEGYGKVSFSQSVTSYFILLAALGINTYAIREGAKIRENKEELEKFCSQVYSINICSAIFSYICLGIALLISTKLKAYTSFILIESTAIIMAVFGTNWINSIFEDYLYLTVRYIVIQFLALICMFAFVKTPDDVIRYCIISVLATNGGNLVNLFYVRRYARVHFTVDMNIKKHIGPLLILFVNATAISIYVSSDITMLGFYTNDNVVGIYSFASKIYNILKQLVNAVVVVSLPRVAYILKNQPQNYNRYVEKIFNAVNVLLFPVIIGTFMMSDTIIMVAGGSQYISGSNSLKILSVATLFAVYASIFTNCVLVVNRQEDKCLRATICSALVNVLLNLLLLPLIGMIGAAITTVIAEFVNCLMQIHYSKVYFDWNSLNLKNSISCVVGTIAVLLVCIISNNIIETTFSRIIICVFCASITYVFVLLVLKNEFVLEVINGIKLKLKRS